MNKPVHVAVGVVEDTQGRILIARRPEHLHQGGLCEFPGGKVDAGEDVITALQRELYEELGILVQSTHPLINIRHDYGDKQVLLDVYRVTRFLGEAQGMEGQPVKWVPRNEIQAYTFPLANRGIVNAILLPDHCMITAEYSDTESYLESIASALNKGVQLIQLRASHFSEKKYNQLAKNVVTEYGEKGIIVLNSSPETFMQTQAAGLHLNSRRLMRYSARPIAQDKFLSASVHNKIELEQAMKLCADFVMVSPIKATRSHPNAKSLGWKVFTDFVSRANCPVYALGGMTFEEMDKAKQLGGQGLAGISLFSEH